MMYFYLLSLKYKQMNYDYQYTLLFLPHLVMSHLIKSHDIFSHLFHLATLVTCHHTCHISSYLSHVTSSCSGYTPVTYLSHTYHTPITHLSHTSHIFTFVISRWNCHMSYLVSAVTHNPF